MCEAIKLRMYFAKIQAELKAQYNDQVFVNRVCQLPHIMEQLGEIRTKAYYKGEKIAPFLNVCFVLGEAIESDLLTQEDRAICAALLAQRLEKVSSDPHFRLRHIMIFGDLENKVSKWAANNA
ncbi:MAG: hypothetical protein H6999_12690 [Hahellaceae bacterium]|nr:hypothetical protein [Hahellaceae bacterium]MCP5170600.1 hypothetical protein [Hahellaceae bacterium]